MLETIKYFFRLEKIRFVCVGILNTFFGYITFLISSSIFYNYAFALAISTSIGVIFNYFTYTKLTFNKKYNFFSAAKYLLIYVLIYIFNLMILFNLNNYDLSIAMSQLVALPLCVALSYFLMKKFVYS